jgi:hypothetical protein
MPLMKLQFKPGYYRDATRYTATGGWWDGDNVRFRTGQPEMIGGWVKAISDDFLGSCRYLFEWDSLTGDTILALGTHLKFYLAFGGAYYDITPIRKTVNPMSNNPFASNTTTNSGGFTTLVVTDNNHGAGQGDYVTFSGATTFNSIPAASINAEQEITEIIDGNSYRIVVSGTASGTSSGGGAAVVANYQVNVGADTSVGGTGWGAGPWGGNYLGAATDTGWGEAATLTTAGGQIGMWSGTNFGENLIFCQRNGGLYIWDWSNGYTARGQLLTAQAGASTVPEVATEVSVSAERHVIAFGCDPYTDPGVQDKSLIRWSDKESAVDWLPTNENSAGDLRLVIGSTFVTQVQTSQEILVWSNSALHSMRYVGDPFIYGISVVSSKATIIGPKAKAVYDDAVYWMGRGSFYRYAGRVETIPCPILDYVFDNLNPDQTAKIYCSTNSLYNEVQWFIPSASATENDTCIVYNVVENVWYYNSMSRTAWMDRVSVPFPQATSAGYLYLHENGIADGSTTPASVITSYVESAPIELGEGDKLMFVNRLIPDVSFRDSTATNAAIEMTLIPQNYPGSALGSATNPDGVITRGVTVTIEEFTERLDIRLRGRSVSMRIDSSMAGTHWHLGVTRVDGKPDGSR